MGNIICAAGAIIRPIIGIERRTCMLDGEGGAEPRCSSNGVLAWRPSCEGHHGDGYYLGMNRCPCQKPPVCGGWRLLGKWFCGCEFAVMLHVARCSGSVRAAIAATAIAVLPVEAKPVAGNIAPPTAVTSRAPKAGWIIVTGNVSIGAVVVQVA